MMNVIEVLLPDALKKQMRLKNRYGIDLLDNTYVFRENNQNIDQHV